MNHKGYSTYRSDIWRVFKNLHPKKTEREFCQFAHSIYATSIHTSIKSADAWAMESIYVDLMAEFIWRYRPADHYFLDHGLAEFCASSVKSLSPEYRKTIPKGDLVAAPDGGDHKFIMVRDGETKIGGAVVIHMPACETDRSLMVLRDVRIPTIRSDGSSSLKVYEMCLVNGDDVVFLQVDKQNDDDRLKTANPDGYDIAKIVYGLSLYMDAFPDMVKNANDNRVKSFGRCVGNKKSITGNDLMKEDIHNSKSPHWRRGHLRMLASEKFVNKRWETVFVRGSFIGGKAVDVEIT